MTIGGVCDEGERYDRQVRIWSAEKQILLKNSVVLVLGLSDSVIEAVKNVCLIGLGKILIVNDGGENLDMITKFKDEKNNKKYQLLADYLKQLNPLISIEVSNLDSALDRKIDMVLTSHFDLHKFNDRLKNTPIIAVKVDDSDGLILVDFKIMHVSKSLAANLKDEESLAFTIELDNDDSEITSQELLAKQSKVEDFIEVVDEEFVPIKYTPFQVAVDKIMNGQHTSETYSKVRKILKNDAEKVI
ncbi:MAG: E1 ubiquitin-activating protein aos1 [Paramarteilia canceri]